MATFDATTTSGAFLHMEGGTKTVFVLPWHAELSVASSGDRIEFEALGSIIVGAVKRYDTLDALLEVEGFTNVAPEATDDAAAAEMLRASPGWDRGAEKDGVIAFRVRQAKRKA